ARHDHRHDPDVARPRRGRRTECASRTRRDRRPALRHGRHALLRARGLPPRARPEESRGPRRTGARMNPSETRRSRGQWAFSIAGIAAILAAGLGIASRVRDRSKLKDETLANAAPIVTVTSPKPGEPQRELVLPGNVEAFTDAPIYARTSGYLKVWYADIGTPVKKGQKLADIEAPEVDQQLQQARAQVGLAVANEKLAQLTADRESKLVDTNAVSRQEYDNAISALAARKAETAAAAANVGRLEQLVGFERIEAPFDGTITARNTDIGQLV